MKELFTLIIALSSMTVLFARQGPRPWSGGQHSTNQYSGQQTDRNYRGPGKPYSNKAYANSNSHYNGNERGSVYGNGYRRDKNDC